MKKRRMMGFTLLEIMIVVAIIGVLAMISLPSFARARTSSQRASCIQNLEQIEGAKERYALEHKGVAPNGLLELVGVTLYMKRMPDCPAGGGYTVGTLAVDPTCSVGDLLDHKIQ